MAKAAAPGVTKQDMQRLASAALAEIDSARDTVARRMAEVEATFEPAFNDPSKEVLPARKPDPATRRAAHRSGTPSKIDTDAELPAFILARIALLTCDQIVDAAATSSPPDRRISRSTLSRWWRRQRPPHRIAPTSRYQTIPDNPR